MGMELKEIKTTFGGPCIYRQGVLEDGTLTGKIRDIGQSDEEMERELLESVKTGRDDVRYFVDGIVGQP